MSTPRPTLDEAMSTLKADLAAATAPHRAFILRHYTALTLGCIAVLLILAGVVQLTEGAGGLQILGVTCAAWFGPQLWRRLK